MKRQSRYAQGGYLLEVPILLAVVGIVVSFLLQILPPIGQKILISLAAFPVLFCLYYMIVIPGWTPRGRMSPPWNWITFGLAAALVITVVLAFIFGGA